MLNAITISGKVASLKVSHTTHKVRMYEMTIEYERLSGRVDKFLVYFDDRFIMSSRPYALVKGTLRERAIGNESITVIHAYEIKWSDEDSKANYVELEGTVKKIGRIKYSKGIPFMEVLLTSKRENGFKSDHIPCVIWGMDSIDASDSKEGELISVTGRLQNKRIGTQVSVRGIEWK